MRLAIPTLILAVILVLGWRVCSGGERDHLRLAEGDLPASFQADAENGAAVADGTGQDGIAPAGAAPEKIEALAKRAEAAMTSGRNALREGREMAANAVRDGADTARRSTAAATRRAAEAVDDAADQARTEVAAAVPAIRPPSLSANPPVAEARTEAPTPEAVPAAPAPAPETLPAVSAREPQRPRAPASLAAEPTAEGRLYVVQPGDWLRQIAREQYGDVTRAPDIARANGLRNPNDLKPGQQLILP